MKSRSNQQVSLTNSRSVVPPRRPTFCLNPLFSRFFSSGRSETQHLILDEQFHECYTQTECKSPPDFCLSLELFCRNFMPPFFSYRSKCKDEICGCLRNDKVQQHLLLIYAHSPQNDYAGIMASHFICSYFKYLFIFLPACRLCDPGWWGISSHVQSGWIHFSGKLSLAFCNHISYNICRQALLFS